jgi:hypothetical protein
MPERSRGGTRDIRLEHPCCASGTAAPNSPARPRVPLEKHALRPRPAQRGPFLGDAVRRPPLAPQATHSRRRRTRQVFWSRRAASSARARRDKVLPTSDRHRRSIAALSVRAVTQTNRPKGAANENPVSGERITPLRAAADTGGRAAGASRSSSPPTATCPACTCTPKQEERSEVPEATMSFQLGTRTIVAPARRLGRRACRPDAQVHQRRRFTNGGASATGRDHRNGAMRIRLATRDPRACARVGRASRHADRAERRLRPRSSRFGTPGPESRFVRRSETSEGGHATFQRGRAPGEAGDRQRGPPVQGPRARARRRAARPRRARARPGGRDGARARRPVRSASARIRRSGRNGDRRAVIATICTSSPEARPAGHGRGRAARRAGHASVLAPRHLAALARYTPGCAERPRSHDRSGEVSQAP